MEAFADEICQDADFLLGDARRIVVLNCLLDGDRSECWNAKEAACGES